MATRSGWLLELTRQEENQFDNQRRDVISGFSGHELSQNIRDLSRNQTILNSENNTGHVIIGAENSMLDGFTVTGGNAKMQGRRPIGMNQQQRPKSRPPEGRPPEGRGSRNRSYQLSRNDFGHHTSPDQIAQGDDAGAGGEKSNRLGVSAQITHCDLESKSDTVKDQ